MDAALNIRVYATTTDDEPNTEALDPEATRLVADLRHAGYKPTIALMNIGSTAYAMSWWRHLDGAGISDQEKALPAVCVEAGDEFRMFCGYSDENRQKLFAVLDRLNQSAG